jgi:uncharacterized membrane protein YtjA (UPF0391 family)
VADVAAVGRPPEWDVAGGTSETPPGGVGMRFAEYACERSRARRLPSSADLGRDHATRSVVARHMRRTMASYLIYIGVILLVISIVAYLLGARGAAGMTAGVGKTILMVGVVLFVILIILHFLTGRGP